MLFKEEYELAADDVSEVVGLIQDHLTRGELGFDSVKLKRALEALLNADRITILRK